MLTAGLNQEGFHVPSARRLLPILCLFPQLQVCRQFHQSLCVILYATRNSASPSFAEKPQSHLSYSPPAPRLATNPSLQISRPLSTAAHSRLHSYDLLCSPKSQSASSCEGLTPWNFSQSTNCSSGSVSSSRSRYPYCDRGWDASRSLACLRSCRSSDLHGLGFSYGFVYEIESTVVSDA